MKIKLYLFIVLASLSTVTFGQSKSLRELILEADVIAITDKIPDPFFPNQRKVAINDHQSLTVLDSVRVVSFLKKGKKELAVKNLRITNNLANGFFQSMQTLEFIEPPNPRSKPLRYETILFAKTQKDFTEVLYFKEINEYQITDVKNFVLWVDEAEKQKDDGERCKLYITKYLSLLERNNPQQGIQFFENILLPTSNFMLYYSAKVPKATLLTNEQKERLKNYVFEDDYFADIENTKLVYDFYPVETLEFYKTKLAAVRIYDDEFEDNPSKYNQYLEFMLKKTDKWNRDTELLLVVLDDYYSNNTSLKRYTFERLVETITAQ